MWRTKATEDGHGPHSTSRFAADSTVPGRSSPFVFPASDGKPAECSLDILTNDAMVSRPDFIIVKLGINDCFGFNAADAKQLDVQIDGVFEQAEKLLAEFRQSCSRC